MKTTTKKANNEKKKTTTTYNKMSKAEMLLWDITILNLRPIRPKRHNEGSTAFALVADFIYQ